MKRSELLASTITPDGLRMTLTHHAGHYYVDVDGQALMSTRAPGSEQAMAELAARELQGNDRPRVLVGGLGLGFTLGAALEVLPAGAAVVVVEYFEAIVDWNREFGFGAAVDPLADPRVVVEVADVVDFLRDVARPFDAILLDVDNGPGAWTLASNRRLYDGAGLARIRKALKPGGLLSIWSAAESPLFEKRLDRAGFSARSKTVRSRGRRGERHSILLARA